MTGMRGIARRTRKTRLQRSYPFFNKTFKDFSRTCKDKFLIFQGFFKDLQGQISHFSRIPIRDLSQLVFSSATT